MDQLRLSSDTFRIANDVERLGRTSLPSLSGNGICPWSWMTTLAPAVWDNTAMYCDCSMNSCNFRPAGSWKHKRRKEGKQKPTFTRLNISDSICMAPSHKTRGEGMWVCIIFKAFRVLEKFFAGPQCAWHFFPACNISLFGLLNLGYLCFFGRGII